MSEMLPADDWNLLLGRIKDGKCTPFLGAGACHPALPLGSDIARRWAEKYDYPLEDSGDLARVAEFLAVRFDPMYPKEEFVREVLKDKDMKPPDFAEPDEPHGVLAELPLPVYITTNYDDFMVQALQSRNKRPQRELCCWNKYIQAHSSIFETESGFNPTPEDPVVFHLHGHDAVPESLVLAEGDYLDFLVNISRDQYKLPARIQEALAGASLLFIGYSLQDWSFRVLFRGVVESTDESLRRISVTVQLLPTASGPDQKRVQAYLDKYYQGKKIRVFWGTAREFAAELREHWEASNNGE